MRSKRVDARHLVNTSQTQLFLLLNQKVRPLSMRRVKKGCVPAVVVVVVAAAADDTFFTPFTVVT